MKKGALQSDPGFSQVPKLMTEGRPNTEGVRRMRKHTGPSPGGSQLQFSGAQP